MASTPSFSGTLEPTVRFAADEMGGYGAMMVYERQYAFLKKTREKK